MNRNFFPTLTRAIRAKPENVVGLGERDQWAGRLYTQLSTSNFILDGSGPALYYRRGE